MPTSFRKSWSESAENSVSIFSSASSDLRRVVVGLRVCVRLGVERSRFRVEPRSPPRSPPPLRTLRGRAHAAPPRRMRNDRIATGRTHRPLGSSFRALGPTVPEPERAHPASFPIAVVGAKLAREPNSLTRERCLRRPREQQAQMESHRLALREPLHERPEPGERGVEVVHVEAPDGRGDLRIRVVRVLLGGASPEALGGLAGGSFAARSAPGRAVGRARCTRTAGIRL